MRRATPIALEDDEPQEFKEIEIPTTQYIKF